MQCEFCKNTFSSKTNLNHHQKRAKYCLKMRGEYKPSSNHKCESCSRTFSGKYELKRHQKTCSSKNVVVALNSKIARLEEELRLSRQEIKSLKEQVQTYRHDFNNLSLTAVKRPVNSTKNIQINNFIQNMEPLKIDDIKKSVPLLTLDHHVKGAEGYAEFALEFPFKEKIVCVDVNRNKIKYKDGEGNVIEDVGFRKMMTKLCESLKDRSFNLCQEHYEKLSEQFTEKELEEYNCMTTALAISRYANGRENDFCNKVIKLISKGSKIDV